MRDGLWCYSMCFCGQWSQVISHTHILHLNYWNMWRVSTLSGMFCVSFGFSSGFFCLYPLKFLSCVWSSEGNLQMFCMTNRLIFACFSLFGKGFSQDTWRKLACNIFEELAEKYSCDQTWCPEGMFVRIFTLLTLIVIYLLIWENDLAKSHTVYQWMWDLFKHEIKFDQYIYCICLC